LAVLGFVLRTLCLLGRCSTAPAHNLLVSVSSLSYRSILFLLGGRKTTTTRILRYQLPLLLSFQWLGSPLVLLFSQYSEATREVLNLYVLDIGQHYLGSSPGFLLVKRRASPGLIFCHQAQRLPFSLSEYFYCLLPPLHSYSEQKLLLFIPPSSLEGVSPLS
jgi:hypothetical protein